MTHVPPQALLAQDMVDMLDTETGEVTRVHATSFREAAERDARYVLAWAGDVVKTAVDAGAEVVDTSADVVNKIVVDHRSDEDRKAHDD